MTEQPIDPQAFTAWLDKFNPSLSNALKREFQKPTDTQGQRQVNEFIENRNAALPPSPFDREK